MKYVLVHYSTRPREIKMYPFTKYDGFEFLEVNQSKDLHQGLIQPTFKCEESELEQFIKNHRDEISAVMVGGDTRSAFYCAVHAFENKLPVISVEAGLRTWDLTQPFPEEGYRQMMDQIATVKYCSTSQAAENCGGWYVGQTGIDTLFEFAGEVSDEGYWICTVHRNEADMPRLIEQIKQEMLTKKVIVFAHPNKQGQELKKHFETNVPRNYREFAPLLAKATGVITDSGGLVEDALALGKKVIQLRQKSERREDDIYTPGATELIVRDLQAKGLL